MFEANEWLLGLGLIFQCSEEKAVEEGEKVGVGLVTDPFEIEVVGMVDLVEKVIELPVGVSEMMGGIFG